MHLTVLEVDGDRLLAGYDCLCGCTPSIEYSRGAEPVEEGCRCGNRFAVGPAAAANLHPTPGFRQEIQLLDAHWGQRLEAAWLVGPSSHGAAAGHVHDHDHDGHPESGIPDGRSIDPVCGMAVEPDVARSQGLYSSRNGIDHFFCGKGCKLEFDEDPDRYLDPSYVPSM